MIKTTTLIVLFLILQNFASFAQSYEHTVTGTGGLFGQGYGGVFSVNYNMSEVSFVQGAVFVSVDTYQEAIDVPYTSYNVVASYFTTLWSTPRRFYVLSGGLGPVGGYESINNGKKDISETLFIEGGDSKVVFGAAASLEFDVLVSEQYSLIFRSTQFYHVNSTIGNFTNFSGVGVRYYF